MAAEFRIDLYSDTHTKPSQAMREAMAQAVVGDEQQEADPTTNRLQELVAELLGKERALFLPSGTMCNAIAYRVWCDPGDEVICDKTAHTISSETGGPSALSGVMMRPIDGVRGIFTAEQVRDAIRPIERHSPVSRLISLENTSNFGGGTVWPIGEVQQIYATAQETGLKCHMDGARLLNAVVKSGAPSKAYAQHSDSLWIDLSKGLGCPVGAVLAGDNNFIERAFRFKHQFGGAMRQSGIIAAAGIYALENNVERLEEDHCNAQRLATKLYSIPGIDVDVDCVETNIVFFDVIGTGLTAIDVSNALKAQGVHIGVVGETKLRALTHLDIDKAMIDETAEILTTIIQKQLG